MSQVRLFCGSGTLKALHHDLRSAYHCVESYLFEKNLHTNLLTVGDDANTVHIYTVDAGHKLSPKEKLTRSTAQITALAFTQDGSLLAVGNSSGKIVVYDTISWEVKTDRWSAHTARVTTIAWNEAGTHAVSGGLDTNVFVWSLKAPGKRVKAPNAHKDGVNGVAWVDGGKKVASTGGDAALKIWNVSGLE